jgi:hypothetical protein
MDLNRIGRFRMVPDTPQTRGMIRKVKHLVRVLDGPLLGELPCGLLRPAPSARSLGVRPVPQPVILYELGQLRDVALESRAVN